MPLEPQVPGFLGQLEARGVPTFEEMPVPVAREMMGSSRSLRGKREAVAEVGSVLIPGWLVPVVHETRQIVRTRGGWL